MYVNPLATLRQLKGAPLSVLIALTIAKPRHVSSTWLSGCTGYATDSITAATWYLKEFGFAECDSHRSNWRLTEEGVQQLPLPISLLSPEDIPEPTFPNPTNPDPEKTDPANPHPEDPYPSFSDPEEDSDFFRRLYLLHEAGIKDPTATELCELEHATYRYLDAHLEKARRDDTAIALLIHRIRSKDPKPNVQSRIYLDSPEYRQRYAKSWGLCQVCYCSTCQCDDEEEEEEVT